MRVMDAGESGLLLALHEGAFEQPLWHRFLELVRAHTGAAGAGMLLASAQGGSPIELFTGLRLPRTFWQTVNPRHQLDAPTRARMREGRIYTQEDFSTHPHHFPPGEDRNAPVQFLRILYVREPSGGRAWLVIVDDNDFPASAGSLLTRIASHLRAAVRGFAALETERMRSSISSEAMDRLNFGWMALDARCRILDATSNVEQLFQRTPLVSRGRYDRLTFASTEQDREFSTLIKKYADGVERRPHAFSLSRDPWIDMFVTPAHDRLAHPGSNVAAMVYVSGDRWSQQDRHEQLVDLFGLLPSEARLAWAMAQGMSISEAADELGITIETARNYSKKIYAKTGARGQAELVRIIFTSVLAVI